MNLRSFKRYGLGGVHMSAPENLGDAYTAPGTSYIDPESKNTGETTIEKDRYQDVPGSRITFNTLIKIYPELKEKMKEVWKQFQRVNWEGVRK